jgi:hypothetical protein
MAWAPDYATVEELKEYLRIPDEADDVALASALAAASRAVDYACNRQFGSASGSRIYTSRWDQRGCRWVVTLDDVQSVSAVAADWAYDGGFATAVTGWALGPVNAVANGRPYIELVTRTGSLPTTQDAVRITGVFGWAEVPPAVHTATLLQASRLFARRESPFGVAGSPEAGSEVRLLARVDPDVEVALRPYRRIWGAL